MLAAPDRVDQRLAHVRARVLAIEHITRSNTGTDTTSNLERRKAVVLRWTEHVLAEQAEA